MFDERDVLLKAASIVEQGWCQGSFYNVDELTGAESVCALGAIMQAHRLLGVPEPPGHPDGWAAGLLLRQTLNHRPSREGLSVVPDWNDAPGRTASEVAEAMRTAALT